MDGGESEAANRRIGVNTGYIIKSQGVGSCRVAAGLLRGKGNGATAFLLPRSIEDKKEGNNYFVQIPPFRRNADSDSCSRLIKATTLPPAER